MLGLGLYSYTPEVVYGIFIIAAFLTLFYRNEIGILFIAFFLPIYAVLDKVIKSELPLAKDIVDIFIITIFLGWIFQKKTEEEQPLGNSPQLVPILLFMSYSFFSFLEGASFLNTDVFSDVSLERLATWKNYMILPVLYFAAYYNLKNRRWKYALFLLLFISFLAMNYKFRTTYQWFHHTHYSHDNRIGGTMAYLNANVWGSFHTIYTLFLIGIFLVDKHVKRRIAYLLLILGGMYSLIYSYSRGAYVGFLIGLFFISIVRSRKLLIPLVIFLFLWKSVLPTAVVERIDGTFIDQGNLTATERSDVLSIGGTGLETAQRLNIWDMALGYFRESPLIGTGFETFGTLTGWDTHNMYLKMLAEQGLIGLFIYLWLYYLAFRSGWRLYRTADEELVKAFSFAFLCAVVGSMTVNFFGDRWSYLQIGGLYWIFWALVDQEYSMIKATKGQMTASLEDRSA